MNIKCPDHKPNSSLPPQISAFPDFVDKYTGNILQIISVSSWGPPTFSNPGTDVIRRSSHTDLDPRFYGIVTSSVIHSTESLCAEKLTELRTAQTMKLAINTTFTDKAKQEEFASIVKTFENVEVTRGELALTL